MRVGLLILALVSSSGCAPDEPAWVDGEIGEFRHGLTVGQAGGCSTAIVAGLTAQLIAEQNCIKPNALGSFSGANISIGSSVNAYLEPPAVAALKKAVAAKGTTIVINSALRSLAQQYLLYKWQGSCGIQIAASPGSSNHETGIAIDVDNHDVYRTALEAQGFVWYGTGDRVHYDYRGAGAVDLRSTSVLAFQRLWNLNHSNDKIAEDGSYGPMTESRLAQSPTTGFAQGTTCTTPTPGPGPGPAPGTTSFAAELVQRSGPQSLESGEQAAFSVTFKNTGTATWTPALTRLGTVSPRDRESPLASPGWLAPNRPAHVESETKPGELGVFTFTVTAPSVTAAQAFDEDFSLVQEGLTWFGPEMGFAVELEVAPRSGSLQTGAAPQPHGGCSTGGRAEVSPLALALMALVVFLARRRVSS